MLLAHNANVDAQDEVSDFIGFGNNDFVDCHLIFESCICFSQDQWTPLHIACSHGHKEVVLVLLAHKANVEAQTEVSDFIGFDNNDFIDCHLILKIVFVLNSYFFIPTPPPYLFRMEKLLFILLPAKIIRKSFSF